MDELNKDMKTGRYSAKFITRDAKDAPARRFRNILANSGEIMESGEIRDLDDLYVMGYDAELYKISDLAKDPEKQTESYSVKAQADHGEIVDGELIPTVEKQFGSCKVWMEEDGLHARMFFADEDALADHAWAISQDASYSVGIDWYDEGYYGTGYEIDHPIGILREISMVLTGNDPRAKTIDTKSEGKVQEWHADTADGDKKVSKEDSMSKKLDELTPEERDAMGADIAAIMDKYTAGSDESEEATDTKDAEGETAEATGAKEGEAKAETNDADEAGAKETTNDNLKHMPVLVIKDRAEKASQERVKMSKKTDWLYSHEGRRAFADTLKRAGGRLNATFDAMWRQEVAKHTNDDITGLPLPVDVESRFISALGNEDGIISHFAYVNTKGLSLNLLDAATDEGGRAKGFRKGDTKQDQSLTSTVRSIYCKMVYKRLALDAMDLYENPELITFRADELVENIRKEIERAAVAGDGRTAPTGNNPDLRMFDGTSRGFFSIKADAAATSGFGSYAASSVATAAGGNLYEGVVAARGTIKTEGSQFIVAKSSAVEALLLEKTANGYFVQPGQRVEDVLQVSRVYTPSWMENDTNDAYLIVDNAYKMIGEGNIRVRSDFDTSTNQDILLDETPRGGSLGEYKSAAAIVVTPATTTNKD